MNKYDVVGNQPNQSKRSAYWRKGIVAGLWATALASAFVSKPAWAIIGGGDAIPGEFPASVTIERLGSTGWSYTCGGTIINPANPSSTTPTYILTSASCVYGAIPGDFRVTAGVYLRSDQSATQTAYVRDIVVHEKYNDGPCTYANDIAILHLATPLHTDLGGPPVRIAALPSDNYDFTGVTAVLQGWGSTGMPILPDALQKASIPVISTAEANARLAPVRNANVCDSQLVVYDLSATVTGSFGDSGSGLYCPSSPTTPVVCGIDSWGIVGSSMSLPSYPYVTTRVSSYLDWIRSNTP
jgi:secreted trypsin-like serine protease